MGKREQIRFYAVSELFGDDERLMAHAVSELTDSGAEPIDVYNDLLGCKYKRWIDYIEQVTEQMTMTMLNEWLKTKEFELDMSRTHWAKNDFNVLSEKAWKLHGEDE